MAPGPKLRGPGADPAEPEGWVESRFDAFLRRLLQIEIVCSVVILSVLITLISCQVFLRYVFNSPFTWAEELGALLLIYLSFVTGDVVYKKRAHISIDYVVSFFPPRLRAATELAIGSLTCICLAVLMVISLPLIQDQFGYTIAAALPLPKSYWTMPVPAVFASMLLSTIGAMLHQYRKLRQTS
jgi:TRAP-type C4-dicarboxylate transport system permease small subunit